MSPDDLEAIGRSLVERDASTYGRGWQSALARQLGVNDRTVRRWLSGERRISEPMARLIHFIAKQT